MRDPRDLNRCSDQRLATTDESACTRCGNHARTFCWQRFVNGTRHIRVICSHCHSFIKYASQNAINISRADGESPARGGQL